MLRNQLGSLLLMHLQLAGKPVVLSETPVVSHEEVLRIGKEKANVMRALVETIISISSI